MVPVKAQDLSELRPGSADHKGTASQGDPDVNVFFTRYSSGINFKVKTAVELELPCLVAESSRQK
ncbi:hypothetical protein [Bradyrhizobium arachidis]|uniref:hypothetical protein n=1 Tax=Bradyrhizobium arachidis TaxID=858423 RepID=UPI002163EA17|nr:hypothetical protein [Bradyrhizobium arachidis]UVO30429.1 hypothetical protein KUF59_06915 [Bradyrhizobium arachidis]